MPNQHLWRQILDKIKGHGDNTAFRYKTDQCCVFVSYTEFCKKIQRLSCALIQADVFPGDRITYHYKPMVQYETIKNLRLLPNAFAVETGEITPTLKMKHKRRMQNNKQSTT